MSGRTGLRVLGAGCLAFVAIGCGSCADPYLARRDTLSAGSGDAVQANLALQVIDPWPAGVTRTDTDTSGERVQRAIERYRNPSVTAGASSSQAAPSTFGAATGQAASTR